MIPIYSIEDMELVDDKILRDGLEAEFAKLLDDYLYPTYGYFIVIESIEELRRPILLQHTTLSYTPQPLSDYIEMIEEFDGYFQVVCIFEADFGVSLFVNNKVIKTYELKELLNVS